MAYLAEIPNELRIHFFGISVLSLLEVSQAVTMTLEFDKILLLLIILKSLYIEASDETANQAKPNIFCRSTFITGARFSGALRVATEWTYCIITLHQAHVMESMATQDSQGIVSLSYSHFFTFHFT